MFAHRATVLYHVPRVPRQRHPHVVLRRHPRHDVNLDTAATHVLITEILSTERGTKCRVI